VCECVCVCVVCVCMCVGGGKVDINFTRGLTNAQKTACWSIHSIFFGLHLNWSYTIMYLYYMQGCR